MQEKDRGAVPYGGPDPDSEVLDGVKKNRKRNCKLHEPDTHVTKDWRGGGSFDDIECRTDLHIGLVRDTSSTDGN